MQGGKTVNADLSWNQDRQFELIPHEKYNLPGSRLRFLNELIRKQAENLLKTKRRNIC